MMKKIWNEGMTLIETAVVVFIISIISALAIPSIIGSKPRFQLSSQVSALQNDIQRARIKSISLNTLYRIRFYLDSYPDADTYKGYIWDSGIENWAPDEKMYEEVINKNVDIAYINNASTTSGLYQMYFRPDGTCIAGDIYFTNTIGQEKRIHILETTGFIKVFNSW